MLELWYHFSMGKLRHKVPEILQNTNTFITSLSFIYVHDFSWYIRWFKTKFFVILLQTHCFNWKVSKLIYLFRKCLINSVCTVPRITLCHDQLINIVTEFSARLLTCSVANVHTLLPGKCFIMLVKAWQYR